VKIDLLETSITRKSGILGRMAISFFSLKSFIQKQSLAALVAYSKSAFLKSFINSFYKSFLHELILKSFLDNRFQKSFLHEPFADLSRNTFFDRFPKELFRIVSILPANVD
jgi:hypothetical protein